MYGNQSDGTNGAPLIGKRPFFVKAGDTAIDGLRHLLSAHVFRASSQFFCWIGYYSILASSFLTFMYSVIYALKISSPQNIAEGLLWSVGLLLMLYVSGKLLTANEVLIESAPSKLSSLAFADCMSLFFIISSVLMLLLSLIAAFTTSPFLTSLAERLVSLARIALIAMTVAIGLLHFASLSLNPDCLSVEVGPRTTPGEEAAGISYFMLKLFTKCVPVWFGAISAAGAVLMLVSIIQLFRGIDQVSYYKDALQLIAIGASLPLIAYFLFLTLAFFIELYKAVLGLQWLTGNK